MWRRAHEPMLDQAGERQPKLRDVRARLPHGRKLLERRVRMREWDDVLCDRAAVHQRDGDRLEQLRRLRTSLSGGTVLRRRRLPVHDGDQVREFVCGHDDQHGQLRRVRQRLLHEAGTPEHHGAYLLHDGGVRPRAVHPWIRSLLGWSDTHDRL